MDKKQCPYCGKSSVTGRHIYRCLQNPQNQAEQPSEIVEVESPFMARLRSRYAKQIKFMSPEKADKFLRKAQGL